MPRYEIDSKIKILDNEFLIESVVKNSINLPVNQIVEFFQRIGLSFPRSLRTEVMRDVLRQPVLRVRDERATLADETNYRFSWFNQFTEVQLNNLFNFFKDKELNDLYLERLWLAIIEYITDKKISEVDFDKLINLGIEHTKHVGYSEVNVVKYNNESNPLFFDSKNQIDGLTQDAIRPVLYKSSTITEIRELGIKYGVNVPKRLKKQELLDIILDELKERGEYTPEKENELSSMNILVIQRFAINNKIKASTELKKEEVIEYILKNATQTRETYFVPSSSVYEVEVKDLEEPAIEEVIQTPVAEEIIEEVIEETVEEPVEEVIEEVQEETIEKEQEEIVTERIYYEEAPKSVVNVDEIEETRLNTVEFYGKKPKKFATQLEDEMFDIETEVAKETVNDRAKSISPENTRKPFSFGRFLLKLLLGLLIFILIVLIIIGIYVAFTPNGSPSAIKSVEDWINGVFNANLLDKYREFIVKIFGIK